MSITATITTFRGSELRVQYCPTLSFKRALKSNSPCIYSCSISYFYNVISFSLLKGSLPNFRRVSVISCLYDLVHLSCSIFLFLCNKLLSNFLYCKTVICLFSKYCGSEIWKSLVGQLVSDPRGTSWGWTVLFHDDGLWTLLSGTPEWLGVLSVSVSPYGIPTF